MNETASSRRTDAGAAAVRSRNLRTIAALAALFLVPLLASFWMYYGGGWRPAARSNHGELIEPPRSLPDIGLPRAGGGASRVLPKGEWLLLYIGDGACGAQCRRALLVMRQTRLALNNEMTRVSRALLATRGCCATGFLASEHPGLVAFDASSEDAAMLLSQFPARDREHSIYIVDPHGNLLMRHDARDDPKGLLSDLRKLLKLSHIG
jgi:hypothetical protein